MRDANRWLKWTIAVTSLVVLVAAVVLVVRLTRPSSSPNASPPTHRSSTTTTALKTDLTPPHFTTPQTAMRYLAAAFNAKNIVDLDHVTNPAARTQLNDMHSMATNLKLDYCNRRPEGDYQCTFSHEYPSSDTTRGPDPGHAVFLVGPASTPGWYMTVYVSCN
jgi:hypothetical protein